MATKFDFQKIAPPAPPVGGGGTPADQGKIDLAIALIPLLKDNPLSADPVGNWFNLPEWNFTERMIAGKDEPRSAKEVARQEATTVKRYISGKVAAAKDQIGDVIPEWQVAVRTFPRTDGDDKTYTFAIAYDPSKPAPAKNGQAS